MTKPANQSTRTSPGQAGTAGADDGQPESLTRMHNTHFPERSAVCPTCRSQFEPRRAWQRYCSNRCRTLGHKRGDGGTLHDRMLEMERRLERLEGRLNARPGSGAGNG